MPYFKRPIDAEKDQPDEVALAHSLLPVESASVAGTRQHTHHYLFFLRDTGKRCEKAQERRYPKIPPQYYLVKVVEGLFASASNIINTRPKGVLLRRSAS
jgi:hypothetical protein